MNNTCDTVSCQALAGSRLLLALVLVFHVELVGCLVLNVDCKPLTPAASFWKMLSHKQQYR